MLPTLAMKRSTSSSASTASGAARARKPSSDNPARSSYIAELAPTRQRLVGRDEDLEHLSAKIAAGATIITLFGPGGIGKTALATELARLEAVGTGSAPVVADLAEVRDAPGVCAAIARSLGVPLDPRQAPATQLAAVLVAHGRRVLVLDACDRAVDAVAELLRGFVAAGAPTAFVVTSRELLGLAEEHAYEVGPLAVPKAGEHESDAVTLFLARAAQTRREARADDPETIAAIVRTLEGIPLALELAAGRLAVLSPAELAARLTPRLGVLTSQRRTEHPWQRTMRAALEWSWTQLEPYEQAALRQLSVFRGGFESSAAEAVVDLSAYPGAPGTLDVVQSLRAKSFVRGDESPAGLRLGLYEIIRELAAEALRDAGEEAVTTRRHATFFLGRSAEWAGEIGGPREIAALARFEAELGNLLAVHARALEGRTTGGVGDALRVLVHLEGLMWTTLAADTSLALVDAALASARVAELEENLSCELLLRRSRLLEFMGRADAAAPAEEALCLARASGSARLEASAQARLAGVDITHGDARRGSERLEQALPVLEACDPRLAANAWSRLGTALRTMGRVDEARSAHERAIELRGRVGDERGRAIDLACIAALHFQEGRLERAREIVLGALECAGRFPDRYTGAYATGVLGSVLAELGQLDEAGARFAEALAELDKLGERRLRPVFLGYAAMAKQLGGSVDDAREMYASALALLGETDRLHEGLLAGAASTLAWALDDPTEAERLFARARERLTEQSESVNARLSTALSLHLGHKDLYLHRRALSAGDDRATRAHLDAARRRLSDAATVVDDHDDLRAAYRLLQNAIDGHLPHRSADGVELEIDVDAAWFRVGARPRVDLRRRRALRLVLRELAEERTRAPGVAIPMDKLIATGWPGEKMLQHAALSRLYVTIRSLRELGLRAALLQQDDGYLLDPAIPCARVRS